MVFDNRFYEAILRRLGYPSGEMCDDAMAQQIRNAWKIVEKVSYFQYVYAEFSRRLDFLQQKDYADYLQNSERYLLCATTLGIQVDRQLQRLQLENMAFAVVFDAVAGIFLEEAADDFESHLPFSNRSFRFCPGYGGTSLLDNKVIADYVQAKKIGITFLDSGLMVPSKSMTGVIRLGGESRKSCAGCIAASDCAFRRRGTTCYAG